MPDKPKAQFDAILCDQGYPRGAADVHIARNREFGPLLGCTRVDSRHVPGNRSLVTPHKTPDVTQYHPDGHPLAGQERYLWEDRGGGVMLGTLIEVDPVTTPEGIARIAAAKVEKRKAEMEDRIKTLSAVAEDARTDAQSAELARLEAFYERLYPDQGGTHAAER